MVISGAKSKTDEPLLGDATGRKHAFWGYIRAHRKEYALGLTALFLVDAINVALPLTIREGVDALGPKDLGRVWTAGLIYLGLMILQAGGRYLWRIYLIGASHRIARSLRLDLYDHLQRLPIEHYQRVRTGDLMSRATNDIESIRMALGPGILVTVDAIIIFVLIVPVMFWLSPRLALFAFAFYPLVPLMTAKLGNRIDDLFERLQTRMSDLSSHVQETFRAIRLIKSLVLEDRAYARFHSLSREYEVDGVRLARYQAVFSPALTLLTNLGTFLILFLGGKEVIEGAISLGTFVAFQRFVVQLSWPMEAIGWAVTMNKEGVAAQRRLEEVLKVPKVNPVLFARTGAATRVATDSLLLAKNLRYAVRPAGEKSSFQLEIDELSLRPGQKVGLVGPVGSGKTTLFDLMLRLHEPPPGTIFLEGQDVTSVPLPELRGKIASVEQQVFLFSEPIATNVFLGSFTPLSRELLNEAARVSCIVDEVTELSQGFESTLGERGINLSGGQKQRLALARALVRNPRLLLLDDSFSAVDVDIEKKIIENFFALYPELALIFASHRLSVMPRMSEVWVIEHGRITDRGSHADLISRNHLYQELWEKSEKRIEKERFDKPEEEELR